MPVTHGADVQSLVPLLVTLAKELFHDALDPVLVDGQGLGWVGEVCTVNHVLEDLFRIDRKKSTLMPATQFAQILYLDPISVVVQEQDS